ncbi:hypothetical protein [Methylobacterium sp. Leaf100]|uniref:DUF6894 family protein n=1 Tax=Methylobacterium sp. Leaf100 TaxID=1736252 RepID=UPI0009E74311|nr:hypothetical protein [Methylobacterium sp. Leaf100]
MPRYHFDIHENGVVERDEVGVECTTLEAAVVQAKRVLPAIAADEVPRDGEHKIYTVVVTDEDGNAVYTAGLSFSGTWLIR